MATVDIIIPVYNRQELVREAIASALAAGKDVPVEIIVVDDASTDGTWDFLRTYDDPRIRCFRMDGNGGDTLKVGFSDIGRISSKGAFRQERQAG